MQFKVTVKTQTAQDYEVFADDNMTVAQFKERVFDVIGVPVEQQRLIFCGRVLIDTNKVSAYDCKNKVIHLVRRPQDGNNFVEGIRRLYDPNNNTGSLQDESSPSPPPARHQPQIPLNISHFLPINNQDLHISPSSVRVRSGHGPPIVIRTPRVFSTDSFNILRTGSYAEFHQLMSRHLEWIPIIQNDLPVFRGDYRSRPLTMYYSDAYIQATSKRRRPDLALNDNILRFLKPIGRDALYSMLERSLIKSGENGDDPHIYAKLRIIANDSEVQEAFEEFTKEVVMMRLPNDKDFDPERFMSVSLYFT